MINDQSPRGIHTCPKKPFNIFRAYFSRQFVFGAIALPPGGSVGCLGDTNYFILSRRFKLHGVKNMNEIKNSPKVPEQCHASVPGRLGYHTDHRLQSVCTKACSKYTHTNTHAHDTDSLNGRRKISEAQDAFKIFYEFTGFCKSKRCTVSHFAALFIVGRAKTFHYCKKKIHHVSRLEDDIMHPKTNIPPFANTEQVQPTSI